MIKLGDIGDRDIEDKLAGNRKNIKKVLEERKRLLPLPPRNERDEGTEKDFRRRDADSDE